MFWSGFISTALTVAPANREKACWITAWSREVKVAPWFWRRLTDLTVLV